MELLEREGALAVLAEAHDDAAHGDGRVAVVVGYGALRGLSQDALAWPLGFAAGAVLASLADTLVPATYEEGGPWVAWFTALGFLLSFLVSAT